MSVTRDEGLQFRPVKILMPKLSVTDPLANFQASLESLQTRGGKLPDPIHDRLLCRSTTSPSTKHHLLSIQLRVSSFEAPVFDFGVNGS
jgi:hypothetical protein